MFSRVLHQLDGRVPSPVPEADPSSSAAAAIAGAKSYGAKTSHRPRDLCARDPRLNRGFAAQIYNARRRAGPEEATRVACLSAECASAEAEAAALMSEEGEGDDGKGSGSSSDEDFLLRWVNDRLAEAGAAPISDFGEGVPVSESMQMFD